VLRQCTARNWPLNGARVGSSCIALRSPSPADTTWRQEVGGSSIEASKIAGHANTRITEEHTIVQLKRQEELTRRIQDKRAKAAKRSQNGLQVVKKEAAA